MHFYSHRRLLKWLTGNKGGLCAASPSVNGDVKLGDDVSLSMAGGASAASTVSAK
jgi:hypothetical protein